MPTPMNLIPLASGRVRLVCQYCGRKTSSRRDRRDTPRDWWTAPFPADFVHKFDGSIGSLYTCPGCDADIRKRLAAGGTGPRPKLDRGL